MSTHSFTYSIKFLLVILTIVTGTASLCAQNPEGYDEMLAKMYNNTVPLIYAKELHKELKKKDTDLIVLDTRERKEYMVSHIKNAKFVSYKRFNIHSLDAIPKDTKIVVYCSIGFRSEKIGEKLIKAGFTNVYNLYGGFFNWMNNGYEGFNSLDEKTNKVHTFNEAWSKWVNQSVCQGVY